MVKDLKIWEISNDKQKVVVKYFRGAKTSHITWHAKPTIKKPPESIIIHSGTNDISKVVDPEKIAADIIHLSKSDSEEKGSNVIIPGLVPYKGYLNAKVRDVNNRPRDYCRNRMLTFLNHDNINTKTHCSTSGLHLNSEGVSLFNGNFVNLLNSLDSKNWHKDQNSEGNKIVNTEISDDSVVTDNETDGFIKVGLLRKKHLKNLLFGHLNIIHLRQNIKRVSVAVCFFNL